MFQIYLYIIKKYINITMNKIIFQGLLITLLFASTIILDRSILKENITPELN